MNMCVCVHHVNTTNCSNIFTRKKMSSFAYIIPQHSGL